MVKRLQCLLIIDLTCFNLCGSILHFHTRACTHLKKNQGCCYASFKSESLCLFLSMSVYLSIFPTSNVTFILLSCTHFWCLQQAYDVYLLFYSLRDVVHFTTVLILYILLLVSRTFVFSINQTAVSSLHYSFLAAMMIFSLT
jgi:hypothetical protein